MKCKTNRAHRRISSLPVAGVSVEMQMRYLRAARVGETILIETETQKSGKNLLFCNVLIKNKESGKLLVHGTHTKYIGSQTEIDLGQE